MKTIPSTNNAGHSRQSIHTKEEILKRPEYPFKLKWIQRWMTPEQVQDFIDQYLKVRKLFDHRRQRALITNDDLEMFSSFTKGECTIEDLQRFWGYKDLSGVYNMMGKIHAHLIQKKSVYK